MLLQNEAYVLPPIKATWSKQQDKQHKNKKIVNVHQSVKECVVQNVRQSLNWNRSIIKKQKNGDFYEHGHAFTTANESNNVVVVDTNVTANISFAIGTNTKTIPVCKWCSGLGHSYHSSRKCGKNKYVLAALAAKAAEEKKENGELKK